MGGGEDDGRSRRVSSAGGGFRATGDRFRATGGGFRATGGSLVQRRRRQRASTPTTDRESRCTVHKGGTWFAERSPVIPTTAMLVIPRSFHSCASRR
eukprot:685814-Pyramimonas_sp.AAC.1